MCTINFTKYRCEACDAFLDNDKSRKECPKAIKQKQGCKEPEIKPTTVLRDPDQCKDCVRKKEEGDKGEKRKRRLSDVEDELQVLLVFR
jgi:hypothetical protein